jgi:hypothetical protein
MLKNARPQGSRPLVGHQNSSVSPVYWSSAFLARALFVTCCSGGGKGGRVSSLPPMGFFHMSILMSLPTGSALLPQV